jgi:hypothetical protein
MARQHIIVDGSNIATEGRSSPSLAQLEEAVAELKREQPDAEVSVIVDATFAHRIDPAELPRFDAAVLQGEYVHPPAGAIGRGDAFLLRVAEKVDGTVLSNDSFQEFHGEHPWLFDRGRLIGATPVPGIGWIFVPRSPVRGPTSRRAVKDTGRAKAQLSKAIAVATKEAVKPAQKPAQASKRSDSSRKSSKAGAGAPVRGHSEAPAAVNDPLTFIGFIADHPLGTEVEGEVVTYTSHGAVVMVGATQCYVPLGNLGDPPPRSAREVLRRHETRTFVVQALDPLRRGVELALPGLAQVSGKPSDEMVQAEMRIAKAPATRKAVAATAARSSSADGAAGQATASRTSTPRRRASASQQADGVQAPARRARKAAAPAPGADGPTAVTPGPDPAAAKPTRGRVSKAVDTRAGKASAGTTAPPAPADGTTGPRRRPAKAAEVKAPAGRKSPAASAKAALTTQPSKSAGRRSPSKSAASDAPPAKSSSAKTPSKKPASRPEPAKKLAAPAPAKPQSAKAATAAKGPAKTSKTAASTESPVKATPPAKVTKKASSQAATPAKATAKIATAKIPAAKAGEPRKSPRIAAAASSAAASPARRRRSGR